MSNPIRKLAENYGLDYGVADVVADGFMERHQGLLSDQHEAARRTAEAKLGKVYGQFFGEIEGYMKARLSK